MHISFDVEPQWLFVAGLVFGSAAATAVAYVFLRQQFVPTETPPSKPKVSRWVEYASPATFAHAWLLHFGAHRYGIDKRSPACRLESSFQANTRQGSNFSSCRSYSPRRVRARRGDTHEHENGVASLHARSNGPTTAVTRQLTMDAVGSIAVFGIAPVSS